MKTFLEPLLHPYVEKVWRRVYTAFVVLGGGLNLVIGIVNTMNGEATPIISFSAAALMIGLWVFMMFMWRSIDESKRLTDAIHAEREESRREFEAEWDLPETIPVVAPEDASDPFVYAMMRAMQDGGGVGIYQDDNGVWRDSDTDEPIPVQDVDTSGMTESEPATPVEKPAWRCGKCEREETLGYDDRQIPKHHRTCPKRKAH